MAEQIEMTFDASTAHGTTATYFLHQGILFMRLIPAKSLFKSTMIHEVVNRGDIFAVNCETGIFTIVPGTLAPEFVSVIVLTSKKK